MHEPNHIGPLIKITEKCIEQEVNNKASRFDLTSGQMHILHFICLHEKNGVVQKNIEDCFELTHATVSGIVSRLENKGYVEIVSNLKDKRFKTILPTVKARECDNEMHNEIVLSENRFLQGFSEEELTLLRQFLYRILSNLGIDSPEKIRKRNTREENQC